MKIAQLVKRTERIIYLNDGEVVSLDSPNDKLLNSIFGESKVIRTEEVIERWRVKNNKEADSMFWNYMEENKVNADDYFLVFSEN